MTILQAYPLKYQSIASSFGTVYREQGITGIWKGWSSKLFGYGAQGACKFGLYEYFKRSFSDISGPAAFSAQQSNNRTVIYIASSLSAQVIADVALCPFEAVKVRVQTQPGFAKGVSDGFPRLYATEGILGYMTPFFRFSYITLIYQYD
jgi:solute carrier family 25 phosphate transporter 3